MCVCVCFRVRAFFVASLCVRLASEPQRVSGPEEILLVPLKRNEGSSPESRAQPHVFSNTVSD